MKCEKIYENPSLCIDRMYRRQHQSQHQDILKEQQHLDGEKNKNPIGNLINECITEKPMQNLLLRPLNNRFTDMKLWQEYVLGNYYHYFGLIPNLPVTLERNTKKDNSSCNKTTDIHANNKDFIKRMCNTVLTPPQLPMFLNIANGSIRMRMKANGARLSGIQLNTLHPLNKRFSSRKLWQQYVLDNYYRYFGLTNQKDTKTENGMENNKHENGKISINMTLTTTHKSTITLNPLNKRFCMNQKWSEYVLKKYYFYFTGMQNC